MYYTFNKKAELPNDERRTEKMAVDFWQLDRLIKISLASSTWFLCQGLI